MISSIEKIQIKEASDGRWQVVLNNRIYSVSEFINHISNNSFRLSETNHRELSTLEKKAMFTFVNGGEYTVYNKLLMHREFHQFNSRILKKTLVRIAAMQSGINKLPDYSGEVYRVASCRNGSTSIYNGIGDGGLNVNTITTTNTFVGACRFAFVVVEHAPIVIWTVIKTRHAKVQPDSLEEVTFPLGSSIEFTNIKQLNPKKIIAHIDSDAELKWIQIGSNYRPFIGLNLNYEGQKLPDFYFLSAPQQLRRFALAPITRFFEHSIYKSHAEKELEHIKRIPAEKRFEEMWNSRLDSTGMPGNLPEIIYLADAEEKPKSNLYSNRKVVTLPNMEENSVIVQQ